MFRFSSIKEYQRDLLEGSVSCVVAVRYYLEQIEEKKHLNAFAHIYANEALDRAEQLDAERAKGKTMQPMHGVVVSLKDVIAYDHHPLQAASGILKGYLSSYSSTAVKRLLDAGAIIIGSCNCDEFAMGSSNENSIYGPAKNAADITRVAGGSSGGSAVAVQAGLCMVSLGSDTGGSVRQPADFCGVFGLKPTYGRISRYGLIAYGSSFDQIGIFSSNTEDAALVLETIAGADEFDATVSSQPVPSFTKSLERLEENKPRIGYLKQALDHPQLDPEIRENILTLINSLKADGHEVVALDMELIDYIVPVYYILTTAEASSNLSRFDSIRYGSISEGSKDSILESFYSENRSDGFGKEVQRRILLGTFVLSAGYFDAYFTKAQQVRQLLFQQTKELFSKTDLLIMPVSPGTAFRLGEKTKDPIEMYLSDIYTVYANLVGIPGISIPLFTHSNGLPFGIQLLSNHFEEASLLQTAKKWMSLYSSHPGK